MRSSPATSKPAPKRPHWVRGAVRRVAGAFCLIAWLVGGSGVLPALVAGVAQIDPQHRVLVERSESGLRLVLNHGGAPRHHRHHLPAPSSSAGGSVSGEGAYALDATVTLSATAKAGYAFAN